MYTVINEVLPQTVEEQVETTVRCVKSYNGQVIKVEVKQPDKTIKTQVDVTSQQITKEVIPITKERQGVTKITLDMLKENYEIYKGLVSNAINTLTTLEGLGTSLSVTHTPTGIVMGYNEDKIMIQSDGTDAFLIIPISNTAIPNTTLKGVDDIYQTSLTVLHNLQSIKE